MNLPPVVFDVDLTLTAERYYNDDVTSLRENRDMVNLALGLSKANLPLIISTARPVYLLRDTQRWLVEKGLNPVELIMRKNDDTREDWEVKMDQMQAICSRYGKPLIWFDDNPENCKMLRNFGITCVQV